LYDRVEIPDLLIAFLTAPEAREYPELMFEDLTELPLFIVEAFTDERVPEPLTIPDDLDEDLMALALSISVELADLT
jgi:hypothetical protein